MSAFKRFEDVPEISRAQQLLFEALLSDSPKNRASFQEWMTNIDFDALDYSSLRLIPVLFSDFQDDPLCGPHRGRMKGIYRYFQFKEALLAADTHKVMEALSAAGIESLLFKGRAIALKFYRSAALRPMGDVDVLVRPGDVARAEQVLQKLGWQYRYGEAKKTRDIHSHDYINGNKNGFDLHWFALYESPVDGIDEGIWQRAEQAEWQGVPVQTMGPEDLVLISLVNGRREPEAMHHGWIYDVALIVRSHPGFEWKLVWHEAGLRGLRPVVFEALLLLDRVAPDVLPVQYLHTLVADDPDLRRRLLHPLIVENRTQGLDRSRLTDLTTVPEPRRAIPRLWARLFPARSTYERWSRDTSRPKHIRYTANTAGEITWLYLHWHQLPHLAELFKVADQAALQHLVARYPLDSEGEGGITVEPGLLALHDNDILPRYHARLRIGGGQSEQNVPVSELAEVAIIVVNDSPHCWRIRSGSPASFGVSYHLCAEDGELRQWDQPRSYFMRARTGYLAFVAPGQHLSCKMKIHAPEQAGRYRLQLDVVQETVLWFSGQNMDFPEIQLNVIP